ncbi:hypothetical protein BJP37_17040 [Moorena bouillonii PNG]|uniref:Uncharacterized protein n=1 Tax=Moorena bouillonii PNG TaxID=568701 RepID=A0A1U7N3E5_9CYAN|nr:hypothetical protein BJP37_17040 [Moorena bouillonii PNG]
MTQFVSLTKRLINNSLTDLKSSEDSKKLTEFFSEIDKLVSQVIDLLIAQLCSCLMSYYVIQAIDTVISRITTVLNNLDSFIKDFLEVRLN